MKKIIVVFSIVISTLSFASSSIDEYEGTTWELIDLWNDIKIEVRFVSSDEEIDSKVLIYKNGIISAYIGKIEYVRNVEETGIHAGQEYMVFYDQWSNEPITALFVASETCLLFPDTEAPDDCLTLQF